jgi:hypothetical protein
MDRDEVMSSDMDMGPAEVYTDGSDTPWKFVQRIIITLQKFVQGV